MCFPCERETGKTKTTLKKKRARYLKRYRAFFLIFSFFNLEYVDGIGIGTAKPIAFERATVA